MNKSENSNHLIVSLNDRVLYTKGYIIMSYTSSSQYYLRSWSLYGSLLGIKWTLLHKIESKDDLASYNIGSYEINKRGPFKHFKIVLTGPNKCSSGTDNNCMYKMRITYLDFFGMMTNNIEENRIKTCKTKTSSISRYTLIFIIYSQNYRKSY